MFLKDGQIAERGTHTKLMEKKDLYFNLLQYHNQNEAESEDVDVLTDVKEERRRSGSTQPKRRPTKTALQIESFAKKISEDDSQYKFAGIKSYILYIRACGGYLFFGLVFLFLLLFGLTRLFASVWIQQWLDAGDGLVVNNILHLISNLNLGFNFLICFCLGGKKRE